MHTFSGLVSVVKMETVLEEYSTEKQRSVVCFWAKRLNTKDIRKEIFPVYGGKCLSRKVVHNWVDKFSQGSLKVTDAEVAETTAKAFLCCGFRSIGKAM
jgi:hypothetical protein